MSDINRSGAVRIVLGGAVVEVPYRRAVGMVATGRATWWKEEPAPVVESPKKAPGKPVEAPVTPVLPEPAPFPVPPKSKPEKPGKPDVSIPARKGVEDDEAGNEPPPIDP